MKKAFSWALYVAAAVWACGFAVVYAQDEPHHKITAQEVAEALADPSATINYFNLNYRRYQDVGPFDDTNNEIRLNMAGFFKFDEGKVTILYRAFLPYYMTDFPDDNGIGDALLSAYWVPGKGNFVVGPGAALMAPTASEDYYGTGKWSAGPTVVAAYKVPGKITLGGLVTHIWSLAGDEDRGDVSITTIMPVVSLFVNRKGTALAVGSETTYNWEADDDNWTIPLTAGVNQILPPFGKFFIGIGLSGTKYLEKSEFYQEWDVRGTLSIVLP
jgi:hypothetical protein